MSNFKFSRVVVEEIDHYLEKFIKNFHNEKNISITWESYYDFIIASYRVKDSQRYSVSMLLDKLKENNIENSHKLAILYAHTLYVLAKSNDLSIYNKNFNP